MPRKKKVYKNATELWEEEKAELEKQMFEVQRIADEAQRLANIVAQKAQDLKDRNPDSCKNCAHKEKCPFYDIVNDEKTDMCLKRPVIVGKNGRKRSWWMADNLFWKEQSKNHNYN